MYFFLGLLEALLQQSEDINLKEEIDPGSRQEVDRRARDLQIHPPCPI